MMKRFSFTIIGILLIGLLICPVAVLADTYPAPTQVRIYQKATTEDIIIRWRQVSSSALTGFHIYRSEKSTILGKIIRSSKKSARVFVDTSAQTNHTYFYTVRSVYTRDIESVSSQQVSITSVPANSSSSSNLTLLAPASIRIPPLDISPTETKTTIKMSEIEVVDKRKKSPAGGWTLSISASNFTTVEGGVIPISNLKMTLETVSVVSGTDSGITFSKEVTFQDSNGDGVSDPVVILSAAEGFGKGDYKISPTFILKVPPFTTAGNYATNMTLTLR